ncbi:sensor histidine kinase [Paenibacillus sp. TRM 82003]|nr:sensor histidine kinase [Paenibacillus sp. TRM 82003]
MIEDVESMSLILIGSDDVQAFVKSPEDDPLQRTELISFLTNLAFSKAYVANIVIETLDGKKPVTQKTLLRSEFRDIALDYPDYYRQYSKWWSGVHRHWTSEGMRQVVTLSRPIRSTDRYRTVGHMQINLDQSVLVRHLQTATLEGSGYVLLLDDANRIIAAPPYWRSNAPISDYFPHIGPLDGRSGELDYGEGADMITVVYKRLDGLPWKLVGMIPSKEYRSQNRYFLTLTGIAVCIAMLLVIVLVVFLIQRVTNPLSSLTRLLKNANPEEPLPALPVTSIDEVGQLIISYNRLSSRIGKLTDEVKRNEALKKEADMLALQVQINPHFLYNTLSSIQWLARMNQEPKIAAMVRSLSDFLRFSLNKGEEYCSVEQELAHVGHYVNIQSIRYPDKFRFRTEAQAELLEATMLKLVLQPLVENAMLHGILKREGEGAVRIAAARTADGGIRFEVSDDGVGIPAKKLEQLRALLAEDSTSALRRAEPQESYGLRNVHRRLLLHYGPGAGLAIDSREGAGTRASFTIPFSLGERTEKEGRP